MSDETAGPPVLDKTDAEMADRLDEISEWIANLAGRDGTGVHPSDAYDANVHLELAADRLRDDSGREPEVLRVALDEACRFAYVDWERERHRLLWWARNKVAARPDDGGAHR